jgi:hypothetical protein
MKLANATNLNRKSGVEQWRDLLFLSPVLIPSLTHTSLPTATIRWRNPAPKS